MPFNKETKFIRFFFFLCQEIEVLVDYFQAAQMILVFAFYYIVFPDSVIFFSS